MTGLFLVALICTTTVTLTYSGGMSAGYTNAPGEANCTSCHSGSLQTSGTNYNNVSLSGNFTGNGYIPDSTYTITLTYSQSGKSKFGYQLTCLKSNNTMAGSFSLISGNAKSSINNTSISGGTRSYMNHTSSGNSGSGSNTWIFNWTAPSTNVGPVTFYTIVNSANNNGGNSGDEIIAKNVTISPSNLLPVATASASTTTPCQASGVTLNGSSTNSATSWAWTMSGGSPSASTAQNPSVVYANPGTYRAILVTKNAKGFSSPDTVTLLVKSSPSAFIAGGDRTICQGDSVLLSTAFLPTNTYAWSNGKTSNSIWVKDSGTYNVSVQATNGCGRVSNNVHVGFYTKPSATLTSNARFFNDSACAGSPVVLQASSAAFDSFYYYANNMLVATTASSTQTVGFDSTTVFGLRVRNALGCMSDLTTYQVISRSKVDAPVVSCQASTPSSIDFSWTSKGGHNGYQVRINGGNWITPSSGTSGTTHTVAGLQPLDSVFLQVRAIDAAPCYYGDVGSIKCYSQACTQLPATITALPAVCKGDLWTITVNGLKDKKYSLSINNSLPFLDTLITFNPTITTSYTIAITDSTNLVCPAKEIVVPVKVDRIGDIELKTDKSGAYCPGDKITFSANDSLDYFEFYWNTNKVQSGGANTYENQVMEAGDSLYVIVNKGVCSDTSETIYVNIELALDLSFTYTRDRSVYTFIPAIKGYPRYTWDFGDGSAFSNLESPTHDYASSESKNIKVNLEIESVNACVYNQEETILLPAFSSISDFASLGLTLYPNPMTDVLVVKNTNRNNSRLVMINAVGEEVMNRTLNETTSINVAGLSPGIYLVKVIMDNAEATARFIKE
jgi:PKD repeat protein